MGVETITIHVDSEAASAYRAATEEDRQKLDLLLSLRLKEVTHPSASLEEVMAEFSRNARARGLTPEILQEILNER